METLTQEEAVAGGYYPMTDPFKPGEEHLLEAAINQLGSARAVLVPVAKGTEIWRIKSELRFSREDLT